MQVKRKATGIFIETTTKTEGWKESLKAALALSKITIETELNEWEAEARRILRLNGFDFPCDIPETADCDAKDAVKLIYEIMGTRDFIRMNDVRNAALCAFRAGHLATRMWVRPAEEPAVIGRKVRSGGTIGGARPREEINRRNEEWRRMAAGMKGSDFSKATRIHARNGYGCSIRTIRGVLRQK